VTQQNSALVEEAAAAAESLQDQAGKLAHAVSVFRLDGMAASPQAEWAAPAAAKPKQLRSAKPAPSRALAPQKKLAMASGSNDEWEEF